MHNTVNNIKAKGISKRIIQFVIFKPLSCCLKETIGFDVKASFTSRPVPRLISWYNKPGDIIKEFWEKVIQFHGTFHGLQITNCIDIGRKCSLYGVKEVVISSIFIKRQSKLTRSIRQVDDHLRYECRSNKFKFIVTTTSPMNVYGKMDHT